MKIPNITFLKIIIGLFLKKDKEGRDEMHCCGL